MALLAHGAVERVEDLERLPDLMGVTMRQAATRAGYVKQLQVLIDGTPSSLPEDQPLALMALAIKSKQSNITAFIQSHIAVKAIDSLLSNSPGIRI